MQSDEKRISDLGIEVYTYSERELNRALEQRVQMLEQQIQQLIKSNNELVKWQRTQIK